MSESQAGMHMVPDSIEREVVIAAPIERVWAVITRPEHVGSWFGDAGAEIDLRPGGAMIIRWTEHGTYRCTVEKVEKPRFFSFSGAYLPETDPREGNTTLVEFTLTAEGDGTRLRVVESGFRTLDISAEEQARQAEGNTEGWRIKMDELRAYAEGVAA